MLLLVTEITRVCMGTRAPLASLLHMRARALLHVAGAALHASQVDARCGLGFPCMWALLHAS